MAINKLKTTSYSSTKVSSAVGVVNSPLPYTTNLGLWLDGSDLNSITSSGGLVSQWSDKSGNGYHATQATDLNKPTVVTDDISKRSCLRFTNPNYMDILTLSLIHI